MSLRGRERIGEYPAEAAVANLVKTPTKAEQLREYISGESGFLNKKTALLVAVWIGTGTIGQLLMEPTDNPLPLKMLVGGLILPLGITLAGVLLSRRFFRPRN